MSLKIYPVVLDLVRRLSPVIRVLRARSSALADQMERALISVPLNVAEGAYSRGKNRQARFQSAAASARETLACLETAEALGFTGPIDPELAALFHRVIPRLISERLPRRPLGAVERRRSGALSGLLPELSLADANASNELHEPESELIGDEFVVGKRVGGRFCERHAPPIAQAA
jgi:four helix bundle protein